MSRVLEFVPPSTSHIRHLSYDPDTTALSIRFENGSTYTHTGVPAHVFATMTRQTSPGSYYHSVIKRHYKLSRRDNGTHE